MAIAFPNFIAAQTQAPDYSGIGNSVENFYKGYNMPKDALIKEIQAKFAQPNAEADLKSTQLRNAYQSILNTYAPESQQQAILTSKLGNKKSQLDIQKLAIEVAQEKALQDQLATVLSGGSSQGVPSPRGSSALSPQPAGMPPLMSSGGGMPQTQPNMQSLPGMPKGLPYTPSIPGMTLIGSPPLSPNASPAAPLSAPPESMAAANQSVPAAPSAAASPEPLNEVVITKGSPQLAGIDQMYDSSPLSRNFLEKKGFKKTQEVKFDNKTGKTTIITKYPSGKVTVQAAANTSPSEDGVPLTNKMISKHQNIISSIDNALPIIKKIQDLNVKKKNGDDLQWEPYPRVGGWIPTAGTFLPSRATNYEALVSSALDSLVGAYGLPSTDQGLETVKKQLLIGHGETDAAYNKRLKNLVEDLLRRKEYSAHEVKKSNKISRVDTSANGSQDSDSYSSKDWEEVPDAQ